MQRLLGLSIACGLAIAFAQASGAPTPTPTPETIQSLIDRLGSDVFAEREAATAGLERIGAPALNALREASRSDNPEVRNRATGILERVERSNESAARLVARRVKLTYQDVPLGAAVNDLKDKTGLKLELDPDRIANPLRRITCITPELPIWEALERFYQAAQLREVHHLDIAIPRPQNLRRGYYPAIPPVNAEHVPVKLVDGAPEQLPGDRSTAVRIVVLPPNFPGHKVTLGSGEMNLCLDVSPAPELGWQEVTGVKITRVIDNTGRFGGPGVDKTRPPAFDPNEVVVFARPGMVAFRFDGVENPVFPESMPNARIVPVPIRLGNSSATSLKRLEGIVYAEIHARDQPLVTVNDPKQNLNKVFNGPGDLRFTILEIKEPSQKGRVGTIRFQIQHPSLWIANARRRGGWNPGFPEAPRHPKDGNRVEAFDAAGKAYPTTDQNPGWSRFTDLSDDGFVTLETSELNFSEEMGIPAKLVVMGPKPVMVQIPFALENIPLP
jgi:hypothetical protein